MAPSVSLAAATWVPAVIAIGGVVVGGIVSGGTQYISGKRKERGERKTAARLVVADLIRVRHVIEDISGWSYTPERAEELSLDSWEKNRTVLALQLRPDQWEAVRDAVDSVESFQRFMEDARLSKDGGRPDAPVGGTDPTVVQSRANDSLTLLREAQRILEGHGA